MMRNPILETINQMNQAVRNSADPQAMAQQMLMSNPQFSGIMPLVKQCGSYKDAFYAMAKTKGVDPETIVNLLRR